MKKIVIIINGKGGVGKDTLCDIASQKYKTENYSSITPIKDIASNYGWKGEKTAKARRFLSDLKDAFIKYNNLPFNYLMEKYKQFQQNDTDILFMHIREAKEIDKIKNAITIPCITLLIKRADLQNNWGNVSDDMVENYNYDYYYNNNFPLDITKEKFCTFLTQIIEQTYSKTNIESNKHLTKLIKPNLK